MKTNGIFVISEDMNSDIDDIETVKSEVDINQNLSYEFNTNCLAYLKQKCNILIGKLKIYFMYIFFENFLTSYLIQGSLLGFGIFSLFLNILSGKYFLIFEIIPLLFMLILILLYGIPYPFNESPEFMSLNIIAYDSVWEDEKHFGLACFGSAPFGLIIIFYISKYLDLLQFIFCILSIFSIFLSFTLHMLKHYYIFIDDEN